MRKPIVAGNWKLNKTIAEAVELARGVVDGVNGHTDVEVVLCTPATCLSAVAEAVEGSPIGVGGQNMHTEVSGAYTGENSAALLADAGASYVILGHSERRTYFGETDALINAKTLLALDIGLTPIVCIGETQQEREAGDTEKVIDTQVRGVLAGLSPEQIASLVLAYEPVWAIGTGLTATPGQAQEVHAFIRRLVSELASEEVATRLRIQYGGSMKPGNAGELMAQPDIDGGLIGGAALQADSFMGIVNAAISV